MSRCAYGCERVADLSRRCGRHQISLLVSYRLRNGENQFSSRCSAFAADAPGFHFAILAFLPLYRPNRERFAAVLGIWVLPLHLRLDGWLKVGQLSPLEIETATVLLRDVFMVDVLRECGVNVLRGEDEDLRDGDGIKPALDPAPDGGKEARRSNDLRFGQFYLHGSQEDACTYEYPIQGLRVMCCGQDRSILHVALQVPELLQPNTTDIHDVVALRDWRFWVATRDHGTQRCVESCERLIQGE